MERPRILGIAKGYTTGLILSEMKGDNHFINVKGMVPVRGKCVQRFCLAFSNGRGTKQLAFICMECLRPKPGRRRWQRRLFNNLDRQILTTLERQAETPKSLLNPYFTSKRLTAAPAGGGFKPRGGVTAGLFDAYAPGLAQS